MLGPISGQYMCYVIHLGQRLYQVLTFKKPNTPPCFIELGGQLVQNWTLRRYCQNGLPFDLFG